MRAHALSRRLPLAAVPVAKPCAWLLAALLASALGGCDLEVDQEPQTLVTGLRVLAVRAEPPEIAPLEEATLEVLAVDPAGRELGYLWLVCDPVFDPASGGRTFSACEGEDVVADPQEAQNLLATGAARPLSLDPTAATVRYTPPTDDAGDPVDLMASLPPDDLQRLRGAPVNVLVLVAPLADLTRALTDPDAVDLSEIDTALALKRLTLSEGPTPNRNPDLEALGVADTRVVPGEPVPLGPTSVSVNAFASLDSSEPWTAVQPDGSTETRMETLVVSWFSTGGEFGDVRTQAGEANRFDPPAPGVVDLWTVVRDGRGGTDWLTATLQIAE